MKTKELSGFMKTRDVEARTMEKIKAYGSEAVMYFSGDEFSYYAKFIEPVILLQVKVNVEQGMKRVN